MPLSLTNMFTGDGLFHLPWWAYIVIALVATHITIACVTLFLHRSQAHLAVKFHSGVAHFMRFWLWLTTGMITREWVSIHRKHHAMVDTQGDPHSPKIHGIFKVLFKGAELYQDESRKEKTLKTYGRGTPQDWVEKNIYSKYSKIGIITLLGINYILFGFWGISIWAVQMMWIPLFAAGVINGAGHFIGYRNYEIGDQSTNLMNIGLLVGGEELHNNHHAFPSSAKMSVKPWEFDIGWLYIKLLQYLRLAQVNYKIKPPPYKATLRISHLDIETVQTLLHGHLHVMAEYARKVMRPMLKQEIKRTTSPYHQRLLEGIKKPFLRNQETVCRSELDALKEALKNNEPLKTVYEFKHRLQSLWHDLRGDHEKLRAGLLEWCSQAEESGLYLLEEFASKIKGPHTN